MNSSSYKEIQQQIRALQQQAEEQRHKEIEAAILKIQDLMNEYGLTVDDFSPRSGRHRTPRGPAKVQFRDPTSGATWSGRGKPPKWIAGQDRERFRI